MIILTILDTSTLQDIIKKLDCNEDYVFKLQGIKIESLANHDICNFCVHMLIITSHYSLSLTKSLTRVHHKIQDIMIECLYTFCIFQMLITQ